MPSFSEKSGRSAKMSASEQRFGRQLLCLAAACVALCGSLLLLSAGAASANNGTITANASGPVTASITTANQPSSWTFSGTSGEVVTASVYNGTFASSCDVNILLLDPNGNQIGEAGCVGTSGFLGETTLPGAGTYTLEVDPTDSDLGSVSLYLAEDAANGTLTENTPGTFQASHTGQGQEFAFTGKSNQTVTVSAQSGTFPTPCDVEIYLLDSAGNNLGGLGCGGQSSFLGDTLLDGKGTYYIDVVPQDVSVGTNTGSITLLVTSDPANGSITANGSPVTFTSTVSGEGESYTFSGTAGEVVTDSTYNGTFPNNCDLELYLVNSTGQLLGDAGCGAQSAFLGETTLPGTGTYRIELAPQAVSIGTNTGSVKLELSENSANEAITENGPAVTVTTTHSGQGRNLTLKGKAGQVVTLSSYNGTFPGGCDLDMSLVSPNGTTLGNAGCASQSGFLGEVTLPEKGTYIVELTPQGENIGANTGSVTVAVSEDAAPGTLVENGAAATFTATNTGQGQDYTFSGTASQSVTITTSAGTFPNNCDLTLALLSPSGTQVGAGGGCAAVSDTLTATLSGAGTYTVELVPSSENIGSDEGNVTVKVTT